MGCDIVFKINGKLKGIPSNTDGIPDPITIHNSILMKDEDVNKLPKSFLSSRRLTLKNIVSLLIYRYPELHKELIETITNLSEGSYRFLTSEDISKNGIVGNRKFHTLKNRYPVIASKFPELKTPYNPDILLVNGFNFGGVDNSDTIVGSDANNNKVYVVLDNEKSVERLYRHLRIRDLILNEFKSDSYLENLMPDIQKIEKNKNLTLKDVVLDFIENESKYRKMLSKEGLYGILKEIVLNLNNPNRVDFINPMDRDFYYAVDKKKNFLSRVNFIKLVKKYRNDLIKDLNSNDLKNPEILLKIYNKFYEDLSECAYKVLKVTEDGFKVKNLFPSYENKYGVTYSSINEITKFITNYRGFNIYHYNDGKHSGYVYTKDAISPKTKVTKMYNSPEDIKNLINEKYDSNEFTFALNFELGFHTIPAYERVNEVELTQKRAPEQRVKVLNIPLNRHTVLSPEDKKLFRGKQTLNDFYNLYEYLLNSEQFKRLKTVINSIQTAGIFVHLINENVGNIVSERDLQETNKEAFDKILDTISDAIENNNYKYYFVQESKGYNTEEVDGIKQGRYFTKIIPYSGDILINEKYLQPEPIIGLIYEVVDVFKEKFPGIEVEVLTLDEVDAMGMPAGTKAFILNGKVHINGFLATSEDVIHEYTHLILGALKAKNFDLYQNLLNKFVNSNENSVKRALKDVFDNYSDKMAKNDLYEEAFAIAFSLFLSGKAPSQIFAEVKTEVDKEMKSIFTKATPEDFNKLYKGKINNIFLIFTKDIGRSSNGLDFESGKIYRLAANWIESEISKGNITEEC